jgi:hypothetical protein
MSFKKDLKNSFLGQSVIEYTLLAALSIILLAGLGFVMFARDNGFTRHFNTVSDFIQNP